MRVHVYRNLRRKCWSVMVDGKVAEYRDSVLLKGCQFKVRPGGNARVLREGRKNVHAFVVGRIDEETDPFSMHMREVTYNPYHAAEFYRKDTGKGTDGADYVWLDDEGRAWAYWLGNFSR